MFNVGKSLENNKDIICDIGSGNILMIGCSGSGKTYLINNILKQLDNKYDNFIITDHPEDYDESLNIISLCYIKDNYIEVNSKLDAIFNSEDKFIIIVDCSYLSKEAFELLNKYSRLSRVKNKLMIVTCIDYNDMYENDEAKSYIHNCPCVLWFKTFHSEEFWLNHFCYNNDNISKLKQLDNHTFMIDWRGKIEYAKV